MVQADDGAAPSTWLTTFDEATSLWVARIGIRWWFGLSLILSMSIIALTKAQTGDFHGGYTDHFHHARAAWTFLHAGWEVYTRPFGEVGLEVPYPQVGLFWPTWPVPYPPGMYAVFLPVALIGRYVPMSGMMFGKLIIVYLVLITHAALWTVAKLIRRPTAPYATLPLVMIWLFYVRIALMGFYDAAWLLPGALGISAMNKNRSASALIWFTVGAFISYRGAAFLPIALVALWRFFGQEYAPRTKIAVLGFCGVLCAIVVAAFWDLNVHSPHSNGLRAGVDSPLLDFSARTYFVIATGIVFSILLTKVEGLLVGTSALFASLLSVLHGGHSWHAAVCVPVLMSFALKGRTSPLGTILAMLFVALSWQLAFHYTPFHFVEELIRFVNVRGAPK